MHLTPAQWAHREQQLLRVAHLTIKTLICLAFLASSFSAIAAAAGTELDLGSVMEQYKSAAAAFSDIVRVAAVRLSVLLFVADLVWMILPRLLKDPDIIEIGVATIMKVMYFSLITWLINTPSVALSVVNGFIQLGKDGAHVTAVSPSDVFWTGIDLINKMTKQFGEHASVLDVYPSLLLCAINLIVLVVFAILAGQFAVTWIQLWYFTSVSPIILAFGMTKWTKDMAMKVITTPIVYGVKFMTLFFVLGGTQTVAGFMGDGIKNMSPTNLSPLWAVAGVSVLLVLLALSAPKMATDLLNGTSSMSAGDGVAAGLAAGGAIGAVAGGSVAMGGKLAGGLQSALGAAVGAMGGGAPGSPGGPGGGAPGGPGGLPGLGGAAGLSPAAAAAAFAPGGAQPPAPSAPSGSAASSPASPSAPSGPAGQPSAPAAPAGSAASVPASAPSAASAGPAATAPAAPAAPAVDGGRPTPSAPSLPGAGATPAAPSTPAAAPGTPAAPATPADAGGSISAPAQPPAPGSKAGQVGQDSARTVINELKASDGGGASIQAHHGDD